MTVGERVRVLDATARVTGHVPYVLNHEEPGMLSARLLRSPHAHARIVNIDVSRLAQLPDVTVLTGEDLLRWPGLKPFYGPVVADTPVLACDIVRYCGEPVAAVAAPDEDAVAEALTLLAVEYQPLPPVLDAEQGKLIDQLSICRGDVDAALATADLIVTQEFGTPAVHGVPLEPHVVIAFAHDQQVVIHTATQTPNVVQAQISRMLGLPLGAVRVVGGPLGGGFGAKAYTRLEPIASLLAMRAHRPVKIVLNRDEEFVCTQRPAARFRLTSGTARDGKLLALKAEGVYSGGAYTETLPRVLRHGAASLVGPYGIPRLEINVRGAFTNTPPCGPLRAPGAAQATWARESHLDSVAAALGVDPLDLRLRNLAHDGDRCVLGGPLEDMHYPELIDATRAAWPNGPLAEAGQRMRTGRGYALSLVLIHTPSTSTASLRLNDDGSLDVLTSSVEMGQGAHTVLAQIAARELGISVDSIVVSQPDTAVTPFDHTTTSSRTTFVMGRAIAEAAQSLKHQLATLAANVFETSPDDVEVIDGHIRIRGAPERNLTFAQVVRHARAGNVLGSGTCTATASSDTESGQPGASAQYHQALCRAEVTVDSDTGQVRVQRLAGAVFAGRMVNPTLCELQAESNLVGGVGQALFEELMYDAGRPRNANLGEYNIPGYGDVPADIAIRHVEDRDHDVVHGIGETLLPAVPPAIANAVFDACGARIRDLPLTPEKVLEAVRA